MYLERSNLAIPCRPRTGAPHKGALAPASIQRLEQVPKKLLDFFDADMFQLFESERLLFDQMIPSNREAL